MSALCTMPVATVASAAHAELSRMHVVGQEEFMRASLGAGSTL